MRYAATTTDGVVHIVDTAPSTVLVNGEEFRVGFFERLPGNKYRITYYDADKQRPVTILCDSRGRNGQATLKFHDAYEVLTRIGKDVTEVVPITDETVLQDRTFRNAWVLANGVVTTDMAKARNIHRDHLREARKSKLLQTDVDYLKALEAAVATGLAPETAEYAALEEIAARKKQLRDVPQDPAIEAAQTPEELKAVWPPVLI